MGTPPGVPGQMASDAVREFIDQIDAIPADQKIVDVLVHSTGGDALTAWKLMSILRERFENVAVLVPWARPARNFLQDLAHDGFGRVVYENRMVNRPRQEDMVFR